MASQLELKEGYNYKAKLPFPQRPGGITSDHKMGKRYLFTFKSKILICDISPFPGLTEITLDEATTQFESLLKNNNESLEFYLESKDLCYKTKDSNLYPQVEFALLQLWTQNQEIKADEVQSPKTNSLTNFEKWIKEESGFKEPTKIKLAKEQIHSFLEACKALPKDNFSNGILRVDGNCGWSKDDLNFFWNELQEAGLSQIIDYFEEPLHTYQEYKNLQFIPVAHEEYLDDYLLETDKEEKHLAEALIIKPSQWSLSVLLKLLKSSKERIVLSSAFELPEGIKALEYLAIRFASNETHGLGAMIIEDEIDKIEEI